MYRYAITHTLLRRYCLGVVQCLHTQHVYCTEAKPETRKRVYDLTTYQFQYTSNEKDIILTALNQSLEEDLLLLGITKGIAKRILKGRERNGSFHNISQLLDIDGFGLKSVENVCDKVLKDLISHSSVENKLQSKTLFHKKRLVKPKVHAEVIENTETILAMDMAISALSWTKLDRYGTIIDLGLMELLSKADRIDAPKLYDKMVSLSRNLPDADIYVWEERANYGYLQKAPLASIMVAMKLAQMRGMLTALLDPREEEQHTSRLYYLKDLLVSKLFQLKVGEERVSGLTLADELMSCERVLDWLPPLVLDEGIKYKYFSTDKVDRKHISTSLFIGLAFQQTIFENNLAAHQIIVDRE